MKTCPNFLCGNIICKEIASTSNIEHVINNCSIKHDFEELNTLFQLPIRIEKRLADKWQQLTTKKETP